MAKRSTSRGSSKARRRAPARSPAREQPGRPRKFTAKVRKTIVAAVRRGNYRSIAFRLAGIHEDTGFEWLKLGRTQPDVYPEYAELELAMLQAEAKCEDEMIKIVRLEAKKRLPGSWLPAMTYLERTRPQRFGQRQTTILEGGETAIGVLTQVVINDPEARELSRAFLRKVAGDQPEQTS